MPSQRDGQDPSPRLQPGAQHHSPSLRSSVTQSRGKFGGQLLLAAHCLAASSIPPFPSPQQHHEKPERRSKTPLRALTHAAPLSPSAPGSANPKTCFFCSFYPRTGIPGRGSILLSSLPPSLPLALPHHLPAWPGCCGRSRPCSARGRLPGGGGRGERR